MKTLFSVMISMILVAGCDLFKANKGYDYSRLENASVFSDFSSLSFSDANYIHTASDEGSLLKSDKVNLVFFGFPGCHGVCPTTMAALSDEIQALPIEKREKYHVVFVNVDQDATKDDVAQFLKPYGNQFVGVVPKTKEDLLALSRKFGAYSREATPEEKTLEKIIHSSQVFIVSPKSQWIGYYKFPILKGKVASDLSKLLL